jgi:hypothetical protein
MVYSQKMGVEEKIGNLLNTSATRRQLIEGAVYGVGIAGGLWAAKSGIEGLLNQKAAEGKIAEFEKIQNAKDEKDRNTRQYTPQEIKRINDKIRSSGNNTTVTGGTTIDLTPHQEDLISDAIRLTRESETNMKGYGKGCLAMVPGIGYLLWDKLKNS